MSASVRQRQSQSVRPQGTASKVADYIKEEFPAPRGQPTGLMLRKEDRKLAAIILSIGQAVWFVVISIGIIYYSGDPTGAEKHAFHSLVWFDHMLRTVGPMFPFMLLATRYKLATLAPEILAFEQQPWVEQIVVYIGLTITRLAIYFIHRLGIFYFLAEAGAVSALPAHLMSDHVFLGSALVSMLSSEAVLLAKDIRRSAQRLNPAAQGVLVATFLSCSLVFCLITGDMYYTCRFYHAPIQNFWAVIMGLVVFQLPVSWWLIRGRSGQVASLWTSRPVTQEVEMS
ncbi:hypothetical protein ABBQ38_012695 [Trebouxia sp. C0009 RCD-2024]